MKKHKKAQHQAQEFELFLQQYARKHTAERPNDRMYSRKVEQQFKRMDSWTLHSIMSGDEDSAADTLPNEAQTQRRSFYRGQNEDCIMGMMVIGLGSGLA